MNPTKLELFHFLGVSKVQYRIPIFQRDYEWKPEHCAQLWSDVTHAATADKPHFLGTIVTKEEGFSDQGVTKRGIIDGQQRLTTLLLLLVAMRDHIKKTGKRPRMVSSPKSIENDYLVNDETRGDDHYRLLLRRNDKEALCALVDGKERAAVASETVCLKDNYKWFQTNLEHADLDSIWSGIRKLLIIVVQVESDDDAQAIFESLNSTGIGLRQSDLIRNRILMRLSPDEQELFYCRYWTKIEKLFSRRKDDFDDFASCYLDLKNKGKSRTKAGPAVYSAFRAFWRDIEGTDEPDIDKALQDILDHALRYAEFRYGRPKTDPAIKDRGERREGRYAAIRHSNPAAITVMRLLECRDRKDGDFSEDEFLDALRMIESYLMRRDVCQRAGNSYPSVFAELARGIGDSDPLTDLKVVLQRIPIRHTGYGFPSDADFRASLMSEKLYREGGENKACRRLLDGIEIYETKEPDVRLQKYQIEHIMPQGDLPTDWRDMLGDDWKKIHEEWRHRLGNLTLTGYNQKMSNRPFNEKKTIPGGFDDSAVQLNKSVRKQDRWTVNEMEARTKDLAEQSLEIWRALEVEKSEVLRWREERTRTQNEVEMLGAARVVFDSLHEQILGLGNVTKLNELDSVSYHRPGFFLEIKPQSTQLTLLLALDFDKADDPSGKKEDSRDRKAVSKARYMQQAGTIYPIKVPARTPMDRVLARTEEEVEAAFHLIRQAYQAAG